MSAASRSGKPARISSWERPAASRPMILATGIRRPRMHETPRATPQLSPWNALVVTIPTALGTPRVRWSAGESGHRLCPLAALLEQDTGRYCAARTGMTLVRNRTSTVLDDTAWFGRQLPGGQEVGSSNLPSPTPKELIRAGAKSTGSLLFRVVRSPGLQNVCRPVRRTALYRAGPSSTTSPAGYVPPPHGATEHPPTGQPDRAGKTWVRASTRGR